MRILLKTALFLSLIYFFPLDSYARSETPQAVTLEWDQLTVATAEGIDVWLRINVVGAAPTEQVNLKFIYQTTGVQAIANEDYEPTPWPGIRGSITGTNREAYIKITIKRNTYPEPIEYFHVELRSDASNTVISGQARMYVYITRSRIMSPFVGILGSCLDATEPNNNFAASAGIIAANGGWCHGDFANESVRDVDYYQFMSIKNGTLSIQLENTTPNQHNLQLYLYYRNSNGIYQLYHQSINPGQQAETLSVPIAASTYYLISVYWESSSGSKIPTYRLSAALP